MTSDEDLMLAFQRGSREAFEELFARYRQPLYRFFRRRISNHARADDLMQETFLAVIRSKVRYEPRSMVRTYLYWISLKQVSADRRQQARQHDASLFGRETATTPVADAPIWINQALTKLEEMDREILMLREYEELSYAEIGNLLHLPLNTVRSRLFRARVATTRISNAAVKGLRNAFNGLLGLLLMILRAGPSVLIFGALLALPGYFLWKHLRHR